MFLPFVLFIALIGFSVVTTMVVIYKNEVKISYNAWQHLEFEMLIQMAKVSFKDEKVTNKAGRIHYTFPLGEVEVEYREEEQGLYNLLILAETRDGERFKARSLVDDSLKD